MRILDTFNEFNYTYYDVCDKLRLEYDRMYGIIKEAGHALAPDGLPVDAGILLENEDRVIAGAFFNLTRRQSSILIHIIFVEESYRKNGIYTKIHSLIDRIGKEMHRTNIYSYIHMDNELMNNHIISKIGYVPVMQLVSRQIKVN